MWCWWRPIAMAATPNIAMATAMIVNTFPMRVPPSNGHRRPNWVQRGTRRRYAIGPGLALLQGSNGHDVPLGGTQVRTPQINHLCLSVALPGQGHFISDKFSPGRAADIVGGPFRLASGRIRAWQRIKSRNPRLGESGAFLWRSRGGAEPRAS